MQLRNIRHFSQYQPGDVVEVPDGAAFDDFHWEPADGPVAGVVPESPVPPVVLSTTAVSFPPVPREM